MADIRVERGRSNVWMWVVALIAAALLVWALVEMLGGDRDEVREPAMDAVGVNVAPATPVAAGFRVS